ncbi:MAG: alanine racemase [Syntrophomonadaceae bacterium]|nr:alanine racemase [Syntrophomonadaceae bacterium]
MQGSLGDKWIEINLDAIQNNLEEIKKIISDDVKLIAVLKANAYGHGAGEVARFLSKNGVDFFAVTFLNEALELRNAGISENIMLFSPVIDEEQLKEAIERRITLSITSPYDNKLIEKVSRQLHIPVNVHLKVDTGLGRFGLKQEEIIPVCRLLQENPDVCIEGIYTHMAEAASTNSSYTNKQFDRFMKAINELEKEGIKIPVRHCANSAIFLKYPHMHLDAVRIGTLLTGQYPVGSFSQPLNLIDPFKFKSRIISLRTLERGCYLGYYRTYRLKNKAQVAVVPVGYNDGLVLEVANKPAGLIDLLKIIIKKILSYCNIFRFNPSVKVNGKNYPVRGKVFMQMALVEFPPGVEVKIGDEVEVPVRKTLAAKDLKRLYLGGEKTLPEIDC